MNWNLEQLRLFIAVAEQRSFSAVARRQKRAQSAISSAIALLEEDLGVILFERSSGRPPQLTEAGRALLAEAQAVLRQCEQLDGHALSLARGNEARLRLALEESMPYQPILPTFEGLAGEFPELEVQISSSARGEVANKLVARRADIGLLFHDERIPDELERQHLGSVEMVTICSREHPLAGLKTVEQRQLGEHRQLLINPLGQEAPGANAISPKTWRADSFYAMAELATRGLGWAWLPLNIVQYPAYREHLHILQTAWVPPPLVVELVWRRDEQPGPAARWLAASLARALR